MSIKLLTIAIRFYLVVVAQDRIVEDHVRGYLVDSLGSLHGLLDPLLGELMPGYILYRNVITHQGFSSGV